MAFFEDAAATLSLAVPPGTSFHVLVCMVDSNLFPDELAARERGRRADASAALARGLAAVGVHRREGAAAGRP